MTAECIRSRLAGTGIPLKDEQNVPINNHISPLPYMVARTKETIFGSDNGLVAMLRIDWEVALFTANKDPQLNASVLRALTGCGKIEVISFPDGDPYQTTFKFHTTQT